MYQTFYPVMDFHSKVDSTQNTWYRVGTHCYEGSTPTKQPEWVN